MRRLDFDGTRLAVVDGPIPVHDGWIRVRIRAAGVCATDLATVQGGRPAPVTMGHELSGVLDDGTPVAVEPMAPCGACLECVRGLYNMCRGNAAGVHGGSYLGFSYDGGYAEEIVVPARSLVPLPRGLDVRDACIVEPVGVALHGLRIAGLVPGQRVAVIGAGAIGLGAVACARSLGCEVGLVARHAHQREAGERLGAIAVSGQYDLVVDAAGSRDALEQGLALANGGATLLFLALHYGDLPVRGTALLAKEIRTVTSFGYNRHAGGRDIDAAALVVAAMPELPRSLITHRFPLEDAAHAFAVAADRRAGSIRVVIEPN